MTQRLQALRAAIQADPARRRRVERLAQRLERRQRRLAIARRRPRPVRQGSDEWFRRVAKAFRRMEMYQIARRRERIAAQPRVGDRLWCDPDAIAAELVVTDVDDDLVWTDERDHAGQWWRTSWIRDQACWPLEWRELVRRARRTQEGSAHE